MVIMYELSSAFANMNSFAQTDYLLPQMNELSLSPFGRAAKCRSQAACRSGLSTSDSHSVTRKKHSKEVELERRSSQCRVQQRQSQRYKVVNLLHRVNATHKTFDHDDVLRHCEQTTETNILIVEQRYGTVPARVARMVWDRLRRLVGRTAPVAAAKGRKFAVTGAGDEEGAFGNPTVGLAMGGDRPLEEVALKADAVDEAAGAAKKSRFFGKLAAKAKRPEAADGRRNALQPMPSVSRMVDDVRTKNRLLELMDADRAIYRQVRRETNEPAANPPVDQNAMKRFFIMKFILARKKPSAQTQT